MQWVTRFSKYFEMMQVWRICRRGKQSCRRCVAAPRTRHEPHVVSGGTEKNKRITERGVDYSVFLWNPRLPPITTAD